MDEESKVWRGTWIGRVRTWGFRSFTDAWFGLGQAPHASDTTVCCELNDAKVLQKLTVSLLGLLLRALRLSIFGNWKVSRDHRTRFTDRKTEGPPAGPHASTSNCSSDQAGWLRGKQSREEGALEGSP